MIFLLLIGAAFAAGVINSLAGGGSFLTFPSLVFAGVPAVAANASSTVALVPASLTAALGYRSDIRQVDGRSITSWFVVSVLGGSLGATLLLITSDRTFRHIAPWLLLFATLMFAFGPQISIVLRGRLHANKALMLAILFPTTVYGGYFGGGMGIILLAAFRLYGLTDIHAMNGIKAILAGSLNAIASAIFIASHHVRWIPTLIMMASAIAGGYLGPVIARRMPATVIRAIIIAIGSIMTAYFFRIVPH